MRKLHDIHSTSSRGRKANNQQNISSELSAYQHTTQSSISSAPHHPFATASIQRTPDYQNPFMMPTPQRQRIDSTPFVAKVF